MLEMLLWLFVLVSWIFWLIALVFAYDFFHAQPLAVIEYTPPVSILKPVKGLDAEVYENFASFCEQDYPEYELLFGVIDPDDQAIPVIERLQREYPDRSIRLILAEPIGANLKASILHQLEGQARHPVVVVNDSDMRATPNYLRQVVRPLADKQVGLVTCCYRGLKPMNFTARLEALHMGATFLPLVAVARRFLSMRFAMGATIVIPRDVLEQTGGFASVADYLADDSQIAKRVSDLGYKIYLSRYVIMCMLGRTTFREQWDRELRWTCTNRVNRPVEYPLQLIYFSTPLAVLLLFLSNFSQESRIALAISLSLRWLVAWMVAGWSEDQETRHWLIFLPVRDALSAVIWFMGLLTHRVVWRGYHYLVLSDGRLAVKPASSSGTMRTGHP
jgi:ceramide glucosyltransferase